MRTRLLLAAALALGAGALGLFAWFAGPGSLPDAAPATAAAVESARPVVPVRDAAGAERAAVETPEPEDAVADSPFSAESSAEEAAEPEGVLAVLVRAEGTGEPLANVRLVLGPLERAASGSKARRIEHGDGPRGSLSVAPLTGADGRAELRVPAGVRTRLSARGEDLSAGGELLEIDALAPGERREVVLELPAGADLTYCGLVVAAGAPIHGAPIADTRIAGTSIASAPIAGAVVRFSDPLGAVRFEARTDAAGAFEVRVPSWAGLDGRVDAPGFGTVLFGVVAGHEVPERARRIEMKAGARLTGLVTGLGAEHVPTVHVTAQGHDLLAGGSDDGAPWTLRLRDRSWRARLDEDGAWELADLPAQAPLVVELLRKRDVLRHAELLLEPGEVRHVEWHLGAGATVRGRALVMPGDAPLAGQEVWLLPEEPGMLFGGYLESYEEPLERTRADTAGAFAFRDVGVGRWRVGLAPEDEPSPDSVAPIAVSVDVPAGATEVEVTLATHRGLFVRGRVVAPGGALPRHVSVHAYSETGAVGGEVDGETGDFAIGPLADGDYRLQATTFGSDLAPSERVQARAGAVDVVLHLRSGGAIGGVVRDAASGAPVEADVAVLGQGRTSSIFPHTGADGAFRVTGVEPGRYVVAARADGRFARTAPFELGAGEDRGDLVLALEPAATLVLRYTGELPYASVRFRADGVVVHAWSVQRGVEETFLLPPGTVEIELRRFHEGELRTLGSRTLTLDADERTELVWPDADGGR